MILIKGERHRNRELVKSHSGNNHHEVGNLSETVLGGLGGGGGGHSIKLTCCQSRKHTSYFPEYTLKLPTSVST